MSLATKRGKPFVTTKRGAPIKVVWVYLYNNGSIICMYSIIWLVLIKWGLLSINRSVMIKWWFGLLYRQYTIWENTKAGHAWPLYFPTSFFEEVWGKKSWNMQLK